MDRKAWIVVIACCVTLMVWDPLIHIIYPPRPLTPEELAEREARNASRRSADRARPDTTDAASGEAAAPTASREAAARTTSSAAPQMSNVESVLVPPQRYAHARTIATLENDAIRADIVAVGAGVRDIVLKQHLDPAGRPILLNAKGHGPIFQVRGLSDEAYLGAATHQTGASNTVLLESVALPNVRLRKEIGLANEYQLRAKFSFVNDRADPVDIPPFWVSAGSAGPLYRTDQPYYVGADWFNGKASSHRRVTDFDAPYFLFFRTGDPRNVVEQTDTLRWITARNQFFVNLLEIEKDAFTQVSMEKLLLPPFEGASQPTPGLTTWGLVPGFTLKPGDYRTFTFETFNGPREYDRLKTLDHRKDLVMEFGFWSWVSIPLLITLNFLKGFVGNYGLAIVLMVLVIKGIFWPLQSIANRNMKKMQAVQPKLKEIQEKFKDQPEKLNAEMMRTFQEYGVNPFGGCLPILVQIPVFFGFYSMLQSAAELRGASFLWIDDLARPDTVYVIPGLEFPINPLPILMGLTSFWQMSVTPMQGVDKAQATMMKLMPLMFVAICYNFSSALALYWTVQNLVGVFQLYRNLAEPVPDLKALKDSAKRPKTRWGALMEQYRQQLEMQEAAKQQQKANRTKRPAKR